MVLRRRRGTTALEEPVEKITGDFRSLPVTARLRRGRAPLALRVGVDIGAAEGDIGGVGQERCDWGRQRWAGPVPDAVMLSWRQMFNRTLAVIAMRAPALLAGEFPEASTYNGVVRARLNLPDTGRGSYRGRVSVRAESRDGFQWHAHCLGSFERNNVSRKSCAASVVRMARQFLNAPLARSTWAIASVRSQSNALS